MAAFDVGDEVYSKFEDGNYYGAIVQEVGSDGTYTVKYTEDDEVIDGISRDDLMSPADYDSMVEEQEAMEADEIGNLARVEEAVEDARLATDDAERVRDQLLFDIETATKIADLNTAPWADITKGQITEVRRLSNPKDEIKHVVTLLRLVLDVSANGPPAGHKKKFKPPRYEDAKTRMGENAGQKIIDDILSFNNATMAATPSLVEHCEKENFKYSVEQVGKNNPICARLLEWLITTTISARNLLIKANLEPQVPGIEQKYQECKAKQHETMKEKTDLHKSLGKAKVQALHLQLYGIKNGSPKTKGYQKPGLHT